MLYQRLREERWGQGKEEKSSHIVQGWVNSVSTLTSFPSLPSAPPSTAWPYCAKRLFYRAQVTHQNSGSSADGWEVGRIRHLLTLHFCFLQEMSRNPAQVIHSETSLKTEDSGLSPLPLSLRGCGWLWGRPCHLTSLGPDGHTPGRSPCSWPR